MSINNVCKSGGITTRLREKLPDVVKGVSEAITRRGKKWNIYRPHHRPNVDERPIGGGSGRLMGVLSKGGPLRWLAGGGSRFSGMGV